MAGGGHRGGGRGGCAVTLLLRLSIFSASTARSAMRRLNHIAALACCARVFARRLLATRAAPLFILPYISRCCGAIMCAAHSRLRVFYRSIS
jgi:hypothetical protein